MNKVILLITVTAFGLSGLGTANYAKAGPQGGAYKQHTSHQQNTRHARDRDRDRSYSRDGGHARDHDRRSSRRDDRHHHRHDRWRNDRHRSAGWVSYSNHRGHYRHGRHWRRHHNNNNFAVGVGLGLLTYHIVKNSAPRPRYDHVQYRAVPVHQTQTNVTYVASQAPSNCLQEREYQTIVTIGGEEHDAYGTACLQPDGSWLQGAPQIAPQFN